MQFTLSVLGTKPTTIIITVCDEQKEARSVHV